MTETTRTVSSKRAERSVRWEFNTRLLTRSAIVVAVLAVIALGLYLYQSRQLADSILTKVQQAEQDEQWEEQIRWLRRYRMLYPDDSQALVSLALASDEAVAIAPANRLDRVDRARKYLRDALADLVQQDAESSQQADLRRKLIARLSQFGSRYADEVERQVVQLDAAEDDAEMLRALALALAAEVELEADGKREPDRYVRSQQFWMWLSQQPVGDVLAMAWQANRDDHTLAAQLIDYSLNHADRFSDDPAPASDALASDTLTPAQLASQVADHLKQRQTDGRAQWIVYRYLQMIESDDASKHLQAVADHALTRLRQHADAIEAQVAADANSDRKNAAKPSSQPVLPDAKHADRYQPQWDYELVLLAAVDLDSGEPTPDQQLAAIDKLDQLIRLPDLDVNAETVESAYLTRGQWMWLREQYDQAWQLWAAGIERLGDASLKLQLANASGLADRGPVDEASKATDQVADLVHQRTLALAGPAGARLTRGQRIAMQSELDLATWTVQMLNGQIAVRRENLPTAISLLSAALDSQYPVPDEQRLRAAQLLATAYGQSGTWDLAATVYERAVNLAPSQSQYRIAAAEAWSRAGDSERSFQQWKSVKGGTLELAVARTRAIIQEQLSRPPTARDFSEANRAIDQLRQALKNGQGNEPADAAEGTPDGPSEQRGNLAAEIELLALAIPDRDDGKRRDTAIERLTQLAERFPDSIELQSIAAISMAAANKPERAQTALDRLRSAAGEASLQYQQTRARAAAMQGDAASGIDALAKHAQSHPEEASEALTLAADLAVASGQADRAHELLQQIPGDQQTPEQRFRLFSYALATAQSAGVIDQPDQPLAQAVLKWENELRRHEGGSGTWWRLARALRLLAEADRLRANDPARSQRLRDAESLQAHIRRARPRWGLGQSLEGQIAARKGETQRAIDGLRRGIASGDRRASTLLMLVSQLTAANRVNEAEAEMSRFGQLAGTNSTVNSLAIAIAEKKGDYSQALELARTGAEGEARDATAWLLLGQAASVAAQSTDEPEARQSLIAEARRALEQARQQSGDTSLPVYQLLVRFQSTFFGADDVRAELQRALESNVPEPVKSLFVGLTYVQLQDAEAALPPLTHAVRIAPKNPDVYVAMSDYYRLVRDETRSIEMLEQAFAVGPQRVDVRNRLALAIALRDGADVPWQRLDQLLSKASIESSPNQLLYALILINRGDDQRHDQAERILRELIRTGDAASDDAMRMLAALQRRRWTQLSADPDAADARRALADARQLYTTLSRRPDPAPMDLYRFADLLLRAKQTAEVDQLADQLDVLTNGSALALDVRLRLLRQTGQEEKAAELARIWAERAIQDGTMLQANAWETAGKTLSNLGFHEQALDWLEQAYQEDPQNFRPYVVGLARSKQFDRALEICREHYKSTQSPSSVAMMSDVIILSGNMNQVPQDIEAIFATTLERFPDDPQLVEAIGTLRLSQQNYPAAVSLYERAEKLAPKNVRVLNNLAMALSEVPGRSAEGLPRIQKAIDLYGRSPELLDTQGLIQLRNNQVQEAIKTLREATANSEDPRFRFHLLMALMQAGDKVESRAQWAQLDLRVLKQAVLTPAERRDLEAIEAEFGRRRGS